MFARLLLRFAFFLSLDGLLLRGTKSRLFMFDFIMRVGYSYDCLRECT